MESLLSLKAAALALLGVLLVEAIPLIHRSKSPILLGDFSVLLPRSGVELIWCAMLAAMAGIGEELLFRGFLPLGIAAFHVPFATALSISVVIFGACHLYQGPIGVVATGFAGAVLTGAYVLTGSLLFAMAVHVAIDVLGLVIRPLSRMGLRVAFRRLT
jgi:membrane protease YdiL (CAAX protease family)